MRLKGSFGPLEKKGFGAPEPRAHSLRNSAHSLARSPEPTVWQVRGFEASRIQKLVWQNHWQGSRGLRGLRRLKGSFGPLGKKDLARQSPEPTVCATPPTVSHRAQSPQSSKCEVLERSMAEPLARFEGFEGLDAFEGQFRATRKKRIWRARAPSPQSAQLRPQSRTEPRAHSLASARF